MLAGELRGDPAAIGMADEMNRRQVKLAQQGRKVSNVGGDTESRAVIRPFVRPVVALAERKDPVVRVKHIDLSAPRTIVA